MSDSEFQPENVRDQGTSETMAAGDGSKDTSKGGPKDSKKPRLRSAQWWNAEEQGKKPHELLTAIVGQIQNDQQGRYESYREYERIYGSFSGADGDESFRYLASDEIVQNELQNKIESLWSSVFKNKIVCTAAVSEADWEEWNRGKGTTRWLEGAFDDTGVHTKVMPLAGIHSLVYGTGLVRVDWKEEESEDPKSKTACVYSYPVNPKYVYVDRLEAKHGCPRSIHIKTHIDRYKLFDIYSGDNDGFYGSADERCDRIDNCGSNDDLELGTQSANSCDMITVWESFHLPSGAKSKDGRHCIWIKNCTLVDEEFTWDRFPLVRIKFGTNLEGYWGDSAVRRLAPLQKLLDKLNNKIDEAQDVMGVPRIIIGNGGAGVKTQHIDDVPGKIIVVDGSPNNTISEWNAQCATPELYGDRDSIPQKMQALLGMPDFATDGTLPERLREVSGPSLERMLDAPNARHAMFHGEYEQAIVDLGYLYIMQAAKCKEMGYSVVVKAPPEELHQKSSIEELDFDDVVVDIKRMKLKVQPMSQFPQTFSGKVDAIEKMKGSKLPLDPKTAMRMLEVPDLQGTQDMLVSDEEIIMKNLSHMCRYGEYLPPMPFDNHDLIVLLTTQYINRYRVRKDVDYTKVALLAQYIDEALALKEGLGGSDPNAPPPVSTMGALGMGAPSQPPGPQGPMSGPPGMPPPGPMGMPGPTPPMGQGGPQGMPPGPGPSQLPPQIPPM